MNPSVSVSPTAEKVVRKPGAREACVFAAVWLMPFAVEWVPWDKPVPLAAHLVPQFWVMFAAVYLYGSTRGILLALSAPLLQAGMQGTPDLAHLPYLVSELVVFGIVTRLLTQRIPGFWWIAPFGLVAATAFSAVLQIFAPGARGVGDVYALALTELQQALPGLFLLGVLNLALHKLSPPADDWDEK